MKILVSNGTGIKIQNLIQTALEVAIFIPLYI